MTLVEQYKNLNKKKYLTPEDKFLMDLFDYGILSENPSDTEKELFKRMYEYDYPENEIPDRLKEKLITVINKLSTSQKLQNLEAAQRMRRGFSDNDVYNFQDWFTDIIAKILTIHLVNVENALNEQNIDKDYVEDLIDRGNYLDRLIELAQEMNENTCSLKNQHEDEFEEHSEEIKECEAKGSYKGKEKLELIKEKYFSNELVKYNYMEKCKVEFFNLLSEVFYKI